MAVVDMTPREVQLTLHLPLPELELAFGHAVTQAPSERLSSWAPALQAYLQQHVRAASLAPNGPAWQVLVGPPTLEGAEQPLSGKFQEVLVTLQLVPPAGESPRSLLLHYDAILHQVVTHKALFFVGKDWETGRTGHTLEPAGIIQVNHTSGQIVPLRLQREPGHWWHGLAAMFELGMEHIRAGLDHLLFLLVLLLPATQRLQSGPAGRPRWAGFAGSSSTLLRLAETTLAFTLGHSLTLLAGSLEWLRAPQQPVEALIALSILVSAAHAVRPIFPGRERYVAAAFGLVHGLAFATALTELQLPAGQLLLSVLGFNLGVEAMQLLVLALIVPWLVLLTATPLYSPFRLAGAAFASVAALAWLIHRISGQPNLLVDWLDRLSSEALPAFAPLALALLALFALSAFGYSRFATKHKTPRQVALFAALEKLQ